uniref:SFRICE_026809 n=1 Tax=Spodoptera frugiperda TaxID=7108 RepID=A0A2H1WVV0_SPOFR
MRTAEYLVSQSDRLATGEATVDRNVLLVSTSANICVAMNMIGGSQTHPQQRSTAHVWWKNSETLIILYSLELTGLDQTYTYRRSTLVHFRAYWDLDTTSIYTPCTSMPPVPKHAYLKDITFLNSTKGHLNVKQKISNEVDLLSPSEVTGVPIPPFPIFPIPDFRTTTLKFLTPKKAGNALVTSLVSQVSMGGGDCLPSGYKHTSSHTHDIQTRNDNKFVDHIKSFSVQELNPLPVAR